MGDGWRIGGTGVDPTRDAERRLLCVATLYSYSAWLLFVAIVATVWLLCVATLCGYSFWLLCSYSLWLLFVATLCGYCVATLWPHGRLVVAAPLHPHPYPQPHPRSPPGCSPPAVISSRGPALDVARRRVVVVPPSVVGAHRSISLSLDEGHSLEAGPKLLASRSSSFFRAQGTSSISSTLLCGQCLLAAALLEATPAQKRPRQLFLKILLLKREGRKQIVPSPDALLVAASSSRRRRVVTSLRSPLTPSRGNLTRCPALTRSTRGGALAGCPHFPKTPPCRRRVVVVASSSSRRRRRVVVVASSSSRRRRRRRWLSSLVAAARRRRVVVAVPVNPKPHASVLSPTCPAPPRSRSRAKSTQLSFWGPPPRSSSRRVVVVVVVASSSLVVVASSSRRHVVVTPRSGLALRVAVPKMLTRELSTQLSTRLSTQSCYEHVTSSSSPRRRRRVVLIAASSPCRHRAVVAAVVSSPLCDSTKRATKSGHTEC